MGPLAATHWTSWAIVHVVGDLWKVLLVNSFGLQLLNGLLPRLLGFSLLGMYGLGL